jgi:hypothetical protein
MVYRVLEDHIDGVYANLMESIFFIFTLICIRIATNYSINTIIRNKWNQNVAKEDPAGYGRYSNYLAIDVGTAAKLSAYLDRL